MAGAAAGTAGSVITGAFGVLAAGMTAGATKGAGCGVTVIFRAVTRGGGGALKGLMGGAPIFGMDGFVAGFAAASVKRCFSSLGRSW